MAFTLPQFVNVYARWIPPNAPPALPDDDNNSAQLFVHSRAPIAITPGDPWTLVPAIVLRVPAGRPIAVGDIVECNQGSGFFYVVRFVERMHLDFPNEYLAAFLEQMGGGPPPPPSGFILMEDGSFILMEDGVSKIFLE